MLILKNITKSYICNNKKNVILKNITISFRNNEFVSILGESGTGKTTLLNIIGALDKYDSGNLIINGISTLNFKDNNWDYYRNNMVSFIFQDYALINNLTVYKNIEIVLLLCNKKNKRKKIMDVLNKVGLMDCVNKKPNELSGGQKQRVAIARALVNNSKIILLDEPTGALDYKTSINIMNLIKKISKNKLIIMVTHNYALAKKYSNRIISLNDGNIINDTNPYKNVLNYKSNSDIFYKKIGLKFINCLNISINNIKTKKVRSFLTILASCIGIIGISLVISLSNGLNYELNDYETSAYKMFPIVIPKKINKDYKSKIRHNKDNNIIYTKSNNNTHVNKIDENYLKYINNLDKKLVDTIIYKRENVFNLLTCNYNDCNTNTSLDLNFFELPFNYKSYIKENYDLLYGNYPKKYNELVLIVNQNNEVEKDILDFLSVKNNSSFDDIILSEIKLVNNNDFYYKKNNVYYKNKIDTSMYNLSNNITLKISGILRVRNENEENNNSFIGYTNNLLNEVIKKNKDSNINYDINNTNDFIIEGYSNISKSHLLTILNYNSNPEMISIYSKNKKSKNIIKKYLNNYDNSKIIIKDLSEENFKLINKTLKIITIVLVFFSSISLFVSSLMISIIIYTSTIERTKEIGILRSLGARKKDIIKIFNSESLIIGFLSGVLGIIISFLIIIIINIILYNIVGIKNIANIDFKTSFILILVSSFISFISGYIPSYLASKKTPTKALKHI